jgi:hypothetical protein
MGLIGGNGDDWHQEWVGGEVGGGRGLFCGGIG